MTSMLWAKLWIDTLDDMKIAWMSDLLYRHFTYYLLAAKEYDCNGLLPPIDDLSRRVRIDSKKILDDLQTLSSDKYNIVQETEEGWLLTNFEKRQKSPDPTARERMLRYRNKNDNVTRNVTRNSNRNSYTVEVEVEEEKKKEVEEESEVSIFQEKNEVLNQPLQSKISITPIQAWKKLLDVLEQDTPRDAFRNTISKTEVINYDNGLFTIGTLTDYQADWMDARMKSKILRLMTGICNRAVNVKFVKMNGDKT